MPPAPDRLLPGLHVVRRDGAHVQVGLDPPHRVILRADAACLDLVELLRHGAPTGPLDVAGQRIVHELRAAGLLVDQDAPTAVGRTVTVLDHGFEGADRLTGLLARAGLVVADRLTGLPVLPDLVVLCSTGPLPRAVVDPWLAEGTPHLVLCGTGHPGSLRVGPLVQPGSTACLRCVDAAEAVDDPRRPLLVEQLATRPPAPVDPLTLEMATAWAARDAVAFLAGRAAATWSATLEAQAGVPAARAWSRHPDCGCCWDELPY